MAQTLKFGNKVWAAKEDSVLAYNDINNNYKPLPFDFARASIGTRVNKDGLIETMGQDIARIDYTDSADGVLLLEPASTNLFPDSEDFNASSWQGLTGGTLTANDTNSPDGTQNATKIEGDGTSTSIRLFDFQNFSSAGDYTFSFFAKSGNNNFVQLSLLGYDGGGNVRFDLENGIVSGTGASIINYGNGWYRCIFKSTIGSSDLNGSANLYVCKSIEGAVFDSNADANGKYIYIWGAQIEGSYPTSYIPTSGSTVTRATETCNNSGNSEVFNDSEGVLFVNTATLQEGVTEKIISLSDGTTSNNIYISFSGAVNTIFGLVVSGGSTQASLSTTVSQIQPNKLLIKYKSNDISFWLNGFKVGFDTSANTPSGLKNLSFSYPTNAINFYGKTKELGYYDTALTDLELETLTSYRNWVSMVNELNLNIIYNG